MSVKPSIVWFRLDLRLTDNPALAAAARRGGPVVPLYIWSPAEEAPWSPGAASRWWLHQSLKSLAADLEENGVPLVLRRGASLEELLRVAKETGADAVFWNRRYEPAVIARDQEVQEKLRASGFLTENFNGSLLREPWAVKNKSGKPFQVFTPFWRACLSGEAQEPPSARLPRLRPALAKPRSSPLADLGLDANADWTRGLSSTWTPGEKGAAAEWRRFAKGALGSYGEGRDRPGVRGTSRLSPHLHFGEISPRQVWAAAGRSPDSTGKRAFLREIGWREFAYHLLFHFPQTPEHPLRTEFYRFPWRKDEADLRAWQRGRTGYPLVDAGMRELWSTGWMHNRARMVAASFLVKNLRLSWQEGARWFWDTLVDADLANNTLGWQWIAGCGADAAPYFRIFNPVLQGEKFDPRGDYVRRWIPELARWPARWIHRPWETPAKLRAEAPADLGRPYPEPVVSLLASRAGALAAYARIKAAGH